MEERTLNSVEIFKVVEEEDFVERKMLKFSLTKINISYNFPFQKLQ